MTYLIVKNGKKEGPYEYSDLRDVRLEPGTLVWKAGFEEWRVAKEVEELKDILYATPPERAIVRAPLIVWVKTFLAHLFFGFGFFYLDRNVNRKWAYPAAFFYAWLDLILTSFRVQPFANDNFGLLTFEIAVVIYFIGYIDVFRHLYIRSIQGRKF